MPLLLRLSLSPAAAMDGIRVLLCHHHAIFRSSLKVLLETECGVRVVGEGANAQEAVTLAHYWRPNVVLLDMKLSDKGGLAAAREIAATTPGVGIIFVSADADEEYVAEAFKAGARAYVLVDAAQTDLIRAIRVVARHGRFLSPNITCQLLDEHARRHGKTNELLSESEKRLFCLFAEGYEEEEIARDLDTAIEHVKSGREAVKRTMSQFVIPGLIGN